MDGQAGSIQYPAPRSQSYSQPGCAGGGIHAIPEVMSDQRQPGAGTLSVRGLLLTIATSPSPAYATEPTGASAAFTSSDPLVLKALDLVRSGKFQKAEGLLRGAESQGDAEVLRARQETLEIIRRTRIEYSLDEAGLIDKIRKSIPDATAREVRSWAKASSARYLMIDGKKFYFRREPSNIFLFCDADRKSTRLNPV